MNEERIAELLRELAAGYNAPPPTPREAIWAGIDAARRAERSHARPASAWSRARLPAGIAAVFALGLGIGWLATSRGGGPAAGPVAGPVRPPDGEAAVARRPEGGAGGGAHTPVQPAPEPARGTAGMPARRSAEQPAGRAVSTALRAERGRPPARAARRAAAHEREEPPAAHAGDPRAGGLYALVATQALAQGEALLTTFRTAGEAERADPYVGVWARDVLFTTRLLLDSPASGEPQMRALLEDLELVLLQIAQLSGSPADSAEIQWIHETLRQRDLLPRLRTAVPAGQIAAGT